MFGTGILVIGHGSRMEHARRALDFYTSRLRERFAPHPVRGSFLSVDHPGIREGMEELAELGVHVKEVAVDPPAFLDNENNEFNGSKKYAIHFAKGIESSYTMTW